MVFFYSPQRYLQIEWKWKTLLLLLSSSLFWGDVVAYVILVLSFTRPHQVLMYALSKVRMYPIVAAVNDFCLPDKMLIFSTSNSFFCCWNGLHGLHEAVSAGVHSNTNVYIAPSNSDCMRPKNSTFRSEQKNNVISLQTLTFTKNLCTSYASGMILLINRSRFESVLFCGLSSMGLLWHLAVKSDSDSWSNIGWLKIELMGHWHKSLLSAY